MTGQTPPQAPAGPDVNTLLYVRVYSDHTSDKSVCVRGDDREHQ